jgi:hypothetical protein
MMMDRRTDMTKLIVAFRNFANAPSDTVEDQTLKGYFTRFSLEGNVRCFVVL